MGVMMDTCTQPVTSKRQYRSLEQKLRIVQEALAEVSVARVARANGVNANLGFNWCRKYGAGRLSSRSAGKLLPVQVTAESTPTLPGPRYRSRAMRSLRYSLRVSSVEPMVYLAISERPSSSSLQGEPPFRDLVPSQL